MIARTEVSREHRPMVLHPMDLDRDDDNADRIMWNRLRQWREIAAATRCISTTVFDAADSNDGDADPGSTHGFAREGGIDASGLSG